MFETSPDTMSLLLKWFRISLTVRETRGTYDLNVGYHIELEWNLFAASKTTVKFEYLKHCKSFHLNIFKIIIRVQERGGVRRQSICFNVIVVVTVTVTFNSFHVTGTDGNGNTQQVVLTAVYSITDVCITRMIGYVLRLYLRWHILIIWTLRHHDWLIQIHAKETEGGPPKSTQIGKANEWEWGTFTYDLPKGWDHHHLALS